MPTGKVKLYKGKILLGWIPGREDESPLGRKEHLQAEENHGKRMSYVLFFYRRNCTGNLVPSTATQRPRSSVLLPMKCRPSGLSIPSLIVVYVFGNYAIQ